ncbi:elongation factor 1-beta [Thermoplasmatales archaeon AK]|nr:elongation factor 1-beta [Thermoplasmatales archaeon AK]
MGDVMVALRILPSEPSMDMEELKNTVLASIRGNCEVNRTEVQEIGYGLKALRLEIIVPDEAGKIDEVEHILSGIEEISQVDTEDVTLV